VSNSVAGRPKRKTPIRYLTRMTPWTRRALELLAVGAWHDLDDIVFAAMKLVPPARAFRVAEDSRRKSHERSIKRGVAQPWRPRPKGEHQKAIDAGARSILYDSLIHLRGLEFRKQADGTRQLRDTRATMAAWKAPAEEDEEAELAPTVVDVSDTWKEIAYADGSTQDRLPY
jgi:hypothetical protein